MSGAPPGLTLSGRIGPGRALTRGAAAPYRALARIDGEGHLVRGDLLGGGRSGRAAGESADAGPLTGTVIATTFLGATSRVTVDLGDTTIMAQLGTSEASAYPAGSLVSLRIREDAVLVAEEAAAAADEEPVASE